MDYTHDDRIERRKANYYKMGCCFVVIFISYLINLNIGEPGRNYKVAVSDDDCLGLDGRVDEFQFS